MNGSIYVGLMLVCAACILTALFRPKADRSRFMCLLLLAMGGLSVVMQSDGAFLIAAQAVLGAVMVNVSVLVLAQEAHERRASRRRKHMSRRAEVNRRRALQMQAQTAAYQETLSHGKSAA